MMNKKRIIYKTLLFLSIGSFSLGQSNYTHYLKEITSLKTVERPFEISFDNYGKIYLANDISGFSIYSLVGDSLYCEFSADIGVTVKDIAVDASGTIFLACRDSGLYAFELINNQLTNTAKVNDGGYLGYAWDLDIDSNGNIFLANQVDGIRAYQYTGTSFKRIGHANDIITTQAGARDIYIDKNDLLYVAFGNDAVKVYSHKDTVFSLIAQRHENEWWHQSDYVVVSEDNYIFSSGDMRALYVLKIQDSTLIKFAELPIYTPYSSWGRSIDIGQDGFIFLQFQGILVLDFLDSEFIYKTWYKGDDVNYVSVRKDGIIFALTSEFGENGWEYSLKAFELLEMDPNSLTQQQQVVTNFELKQNHPNPFNPTTTIEFYLDKNNQVELSIFNINGHKVAELLNGYMYNGNHQYKFNADGLASGIYFYQMKVGKFSKIKKMIILK